MDSSIVVTVQRCDLWFQKHFLLVVHLFSITSFNIRQNFASPVGQLLSDSLAFRQMSAIIT